MLMSYRSDGLDYYNEDHEERLEAIYNLTLEGTPDNVKSHHICANYILTQKLFEGMEWIVSVVVIVYNILIYMIIEIIMNRVGYRMQTVQHKIIHHLIFVCLVVDTALFPVILNINWKDHDWYAPGEVFYKGHYTDINDEWMKDIGEIIAVSIVIQALQPVWSVLVAYLLEKIFICCVNKEQKKKGMSDQDYMLQHDGH